MIRKLILIVGVSLSLVAFGCSSDGGGSAGAGGDGGTAGMGGEGGAAGMGGEGGGAGGGGVTDACLNADDLAAVCDPGYSEQVSQCATDASGDAADTSTCLQMDPPGLSADCADCQGVQVECIRDNCVLGEDNSCFPPVADQAACDQCVDDSGCSAAYDTCAGDIAANCAG